MAAVCFRFVAKWHAADVLAGHLYVRVCVCETHVSSCLPNDLAT